MTEQNDICLVSCVGAKRTYATAAKDLYTSDWFVKARRYVEISGWRWYILSAEYGLVNHDEVIDPYERTLNTMRRCDRQQWANLVIQQFSAIPAFEGVTILAGERYREFLELYFAERKLKVTVPMRGLGIGKQKQWLQRSISASNHTCTDITLRAG